MSARSTYPDTERRAATTRPDRYDDEGTGWVAFAGVMLAILGILNFIYGIAAIGDAHFYVANAQYVISDLNTWGWIVMIIGAVQFLAALAIFGGSTWGKWVGIASAGCNAIAQLLFLPSYPFLSLALFAVDVLVIYGLVAHAGRRMAA